MEKNKVDLRFCIFDFEDTSHIELTDLLGIAPVYVHIKGEKRNPRNPDSPLWKNNSWCINSGLDEYASFEDQMNKLLEIVEQKIDSFRIVCSKYYCEFSCAIFIYRDNDESTPWVHLDNRYNKISSELGIEFDIDLYAF